MPQAMSLERFAELTVRMTSGEKRSDVLESAHLDLETWETSQQYWLGKMATEAARDRYSLAQRYAVLYKAAQMRLSGATTSTRKRARGAQQQVVVRAIPAVPATPSRVAPSASSVAPSGSSVASSASSTAAPPPPAMAPASVAPPPSMGGPPASVPAPSRGAYTSRLTLEQLAAMRAEIASAPDAEQTGVMQRFGLDAATWEEEETHWQRRLAGDQELFKRYLRQFQYCRSLLQRT
jgi:hypothetical protein